MKKMLSILVLVLLLSPVYSGLAQATYYHFEDNGEANVSFITGTEFTWKFDLNADYMKLWTITEIPLTSDGTNWSIYDTNYYGVGHMSATDILHRAYLTMKFVGVKNDNEAEQIDFTLDLQTIIEDWLLKQGSLPCQIIPNLSLLPDDQNAPGTLNVFSYLKDDHYLYVTIEALQGDFTVEKMDLTGCYESAPAPIPEPGTLVLLGLGFVLLSVLLRRKVLLAPSKIRR